MNTELNIKEIVKEVLAEMDREKRRRAELKKDIQEFFPKLKIPSDLSTEELENFLSTLKKLGFKKIEIDEQPRKKSVQKITKKIKYAIGGIAFTVTAAIFLLLYGLSLGVP